MDRAKTWTGWALAASLAGAGSAAAQTVQWRPGISPAELSGARIVRAPATLRRQDLDALRPDQIIETPSGRHIEVAKFRAIQRAFDLARARTAVQRRQDFPILAPTPRGAPVVALRPHETVAEITARPANQVVRLRDGQSATVAQLKAVADHLATLHRPPPVRVPPTGPAIRIRSLADLKSLPPSTPDSTVLETPQGKRVTVGEIRAVMKGRGPMGRVPAGRAAQ